MKHKPLPKLGSDPMDAYSIPVTAEKTRLAQVFGMRPREKPEKPGRSLSVVWDGRKPLVEGFENRYSYTVTFEREGSCAGNHFHEEKRELFIPVVGNFRVLLEDVATKDKEEIRLETARHPVLLVRPGIAHAAIAESVPAVLLVLATYPASEEDEFAYKL